MKTPKNNNNKDLPMLSTAHANVFADNRESGSTDIDSLIYLY